MPRANYPVKGLVDTWGRKNRKIADKRCQHCGAEFRPKRATAKYCSRPCSWANNGGHNRQAETWWVNSRGYVEGRVVEDGQQRAIKQHRYVMEAKLGRKLSANEVVHHKNGNKTDNRPENLELMKFGEHSTHHNRAREYKKGYKMNLSSAERAARSERMRQQRAKQTASPKARG